MAQMILESAWGERIIGNNAFGIKAAGQKSPYWGGDSIDANTFEYYNADQNPVNIRTAFRAYETVTDSIKDHTYFLKQNPRYALAGVFDAKDYREQAYALARAGYATDPNYAQKLIQIIEQYKLNELDQKKK